MKEEYINKFLYKLGLKPLLHKAKWPMGFQICAYITDLELYTAKSIPNIKILLKAKVGELRVHVNALLDELEKRIDKTEGEQIQ